MTIVTSTKVTATEQGHSLWAGMAIEAASPLGSRSGVIAGLDLTKSAGMGFTIGQGRGGVQYTTSATSGWIPFSVTAAEVGSFDPGDSVKDRVDLVEARIVGGAVTIVVKKGALPSSGAPVKPTLDPDAVALFYVPIAAGTSAGSGGWNEASVIDARRFLNGGGQVGDVKYSAVPITTGSHRGWLYANGAAIDRTIYAELFAAIGVAYGAGDGATTFNLPDLREVVPVGIRSGSTEHGTLGQKFGTKTVTLTTPQIPSHQHLINGVMGVTEAGGGNRYSTGYGPTRPNTGIVTDAAGGGGAHNNIQPSIALVPLIKY